MIMNDTRSTHRSRVPQRSSGRINSDDSGGERREDKAWTLFCDLCVAVIREGLPLYFCVCLFYY